MSFFLFLLGNIQWEKMNTKSKCCLLKKKENKGNIDDRTLERIYDEIKSREQQIWKESTSKLIDSMAANNDANTSDIYLIDFFIYCPSLCVKEGQVWIGDFIILFFLFEILFRKLGRFFITIHQVSISTVKYVELVIVKV